MYKLDKNIRNTENKIRRCRNKRWLWESSECAYGKWQTTVEIVKC